MPDKAFDEFWESTGGKPGAYRNYCYQGWRAGIQHAEEKFTSTNSAMVQCLCVDCMLNESCQFTKGKERYGCSVYYAQHQ